MKAIITTAILFCALIFSALSMTAGASEPGASNHTGETVFERSTELAKSSIISERAYRDLLREARVQGSDRDVGTQRQLATSRPAPRALSTKVVQATAISATDAATDRLVEQQLAALKVRKATKTAAAAKAQGSGS